MNSTTLTKIFPPPSKKEIIQRLYADKHITFDEMYTLIEGDNLRYNPLKEPFFTPDEPQWEKPYPSLPYTGDPVPGQEPHTISDNIKRTATYSIPDLGISNVVRGMHDYNTNYNNNHPVYGKDY